MTPQGFHEVPCFGVLQIGDLKTPYWGALQSTLVGFLEPFLWVL